MAPQSYFLQSARLGFRHWTPDDWPLARELWGDIAVTRFFGGPFSETQIAERLKIELARQTQYGFQYWPIHLCRTGEAVGCCGLRPYRPPEEIHEIGFHLRPRFWGQGLAQEAARTVLRYAFKVLRAQGICAGHHPENLASQRTIEKLGFRYSHDERFVALDMDIPYYLIWRPADGSGEQ
jgi:[ribosomal protein S5]-alanine N-acetyltransferase